MIFLLFLNSDKHVIYLNNVHDETISIYYKKEFLALVSNFSKADSFIEVCTSNKIKRLHVVNINYDKILKDIDSLNILIDYSKDELKYLLKSVCGIDI